MPPTEGLTVSLTTTSRRVGRVAEVVRTLLDQQVQPARIVLWLSREPFLLDDGVAPDDLPHALQALRSERFLIRWTENIGPYRKLVPALRAYGGTVVTVDDDMLYPPDWLGGLLEMRAQTPDAVCCYRARRMLTGERGELRRYWRWPRLQCATPRADVLPIGKDGVLYPPGSLHPDVMDANRFLELAPTCDDIWFKAMALRAGVLARSAPDHTSFRILGPTVSWIGLFTRFNVLENDQALMRVFDAYALNPAAITAAA